MLDGQEYLPGCWVSLVLGRNYICIEKEKEYFDIACDRISQPREYSETELEAMELKQPEFKQLSLFDVA